MANRNKVLGTLLIRGVSITAQLGFFVLLARTSSLEVVGMFAIAMALWVLARALVPLGWNVAVLREASVLTAARKLAQRRLLLTTAIGETLVSGAVMCFLLFLAVLFFQPDQLLTWITGATVGILWAIVAVLVAFLRASGDLLRSQVGDGVIIHLVPLLIFVGASIWGVGITIDVVFLSFLASAILAVTFLLSSIRNICKGQEVVDERIPEEITGARRLAHRLWWNQAFSAISSRAPVMLSAGFGGVSASAVIEAGLRTQLVGATLAWAGGTVASPKYAVDYSKGGRKGALLLSAITWATLLPTMGVVLVLIAWGEPILGFLGSEFANERLAITLMAFAAVLEAPAACGGYFLMMSGRERVASSSTLLQLVVLCCSAVLLNPLGGALSIAIAVALGTLSKSVLVMISMRGLTSPLSWRGLVFLLRQVKRG